MKISNRISPDSLEEGDHIYTWRAFFTFSHHGIYCGNKVVIHYTRQHDAKDSNFSSFSSSKHREETTCCVTGVTECGSRKDGSGVISSCIECFLAGGALYKYEYGMRKSQLAIQPRGGIGTMAISDEAKLVTRRAHYLLEHGFGLYNLLENNCEDFALYCKTGLQIREGKKTKGRSGQKASLVSALFGILFSSSNFLGVAAALGIYLSNKFESEIGVREDAVKVEVEEMIPYKAK